MNSIERKAKEALDNLTSLINETLKELEVENVEDGLHKLENIRKEIGKRTSPTTSIEKYKTGIEPKV